MTVLLCGANGQLGTEVIKSLKTGRTELGVLPQELFDVKLICTDSATLDITDAETVRGFIEGVHPDIIINCAAFTNVDLCEEEEDAALKINAYGVKNLAESANAVGAKLVHISTDYVFSGDSCVPYREADSCAPNSAYGRTKLMGEAAAAVCEKHFIVRTAWLYGHNGKNFVKTMIRLGKERETVTVVSDQRGCPTNCSDLSHFILLLMCTDKYGIYHCTGKGDCTWYEFAKEIIGAINPHCIVEPCTSDEYKSKVKRPKYSVLNCEKICAAVGIEPRDRKKALEAFLKEECEEL